MSTDQFWEIVDRVYIASGGDMERKCELLAAELHRLPIPELKQWDAHLTNSFYQAFSNILWGAAHLINRGCGDDSFMDFRFNLISMGRQTYERALADADSLADVDFQDSRYEGYQYVPGSVYRERMLAEGRTEPELEAEREREHAQSPRHPRHPSGEPFNEWEMEGRYPRLAAKHGHKDANFEGANKRALKLSADLRRAERLADLLWDSGIIPACGKVPPFGVAAAVLRTGQSPPATGRQLTWPPIELGEGDYWYTLLQVCRPNTARLRSRPDLKGRKIEHDPDIVPDNDYNSWLQSLKNRGFA